MGQELSKKIHYNTQRCNYKTNSVNLLNVINTQTVSELIHELLNILDLLNILYLLNIFYTAFLINPTLIAFVLFTLLGLVAFLSKVLITYSSANQYCLFPGAILQF